jgi:glycosyltransferase involved in cell wall biosynthesis
LNRVHVIPNAVPAHALTPTRARAEVRKELGVSESDFLALLIANLREEKRADVFVNAVALVAADVRIVGVVAGDGPCFRQVQALARESNGVVKMLGHRDDVVDLILAADAVCLTSDTEALPMCVLEAMALGRPVVATKVGDVPAAIADGVSGVLVEPAHSVAFAEALVRLARDPESTKLMGIAAKARATGLFGWEPMVDAYEAVLSWAAAHPAGVRWTDAPDLARGSAK